MQLARQRRRPHLVVAWFLLAALILAGAGPSVATAAAATGTAAAASNGRLVVAMPELLTSFDYPYDWDQTATYIQSNIGDCLVWRDRTTGKFIPWLAESYKNTGPTSWTLKLRQGIKFTNGEPFNAEAAKFTIDRILHDPTALVYAQWTFIKQVKILDDYDIEIDTASPEPAFLSKIAQTACQVVPPKYYQQVGKAGFSQHPIGTGPYELVQWVKDDSVTLKANPSYWRGAPKIGEIVFRDIPESSTAVAALLSGEVDLVMTVPDQFWKQINANSGLVLNRFVTSNVMILDLRAGPSPQMPKFVGPTTDPKVREAIALSIDRSQLIQLLDGMGIPTETRVTPPTPCVNQKLYNNPGEYNPQKAKQLLAEAGYHGQKLTFQTAASTYPHVSDVAQAVTAMLQNVGLNVQLQIMDNSAFREQVYAPYHNQDLYIDALQNSFFDPWITVLSERSDQRQRSGWSGSQADEADRLIRAAAVNMDPATRCQQYEQLQELTFAGNGGPYVPLYQLKDAYAMKKQVNFTMPPDQFLWFGDASVR